MPVPFLRALRFTPILGLAGALAGAAPAAATTLVDPTGDSVSHDITSITGVYTASSWILSASFDTGTLAPADLGFIFGLDTDQNLATGQNNAGGVIFPLGAEVSIKYHVGQNATHAMVNLWVPSLSALALAGLVPVSFGPDFVQVVVPLSLSADLGGGMMFPFSDDGLALFGFVTGRLFDADAFEADDFAPDSSDDGPLGGPTSFVPEPSASALALSALACLALARRRARGGPR